MSASRDFDRPLSSYGRIQAVDAGNDMQKKGFLPDAIIHSSAVRTSETTELVQKAFIPKPSCSDEQDLYNSHPKTILDLINKADNKFKTLLLIAHNPGVSIVTNQLCSENRYYAYQPADWHVLDFEAESWSEICIASGSPLDHE